MKFFTALFLVVSAGSAFGDTLPNYLGDVKGVLLTGLTARESFEFSPGQVGDCTRKEAMDLIVYQCPVANARVTVSGQGGSPLNVTFDKLVVMYKSLKNGELRREYTFGATQWSKVEPKATLNTPVRMLLWTTQGNPTDVRGWVELVDYKVFGSVQATSSR